LAYVADVFAWLSLRVDGLPLLYGGCAFCRAPLSGSANFLPGMPGVRPSRNPRALLRRADLGGFVHLHRSTLWERRKVLRNFMCDFRERTGCLPQFASDGS
jgi:hypothetical protein